MSDPMRRSERDKLGPDLQHHLAAMRADGAAPRPMSIILRATSKRFPSLVRQEAPQWHSEALDLVALLRTPAEILSLCPDRGVLFVERDEVFTKWAPQPLPAIGPANADVHGRYKQGRLRDLNGAGVKILIQDSGISPHPDLPAIQAFDVTGENSTRDRHGHGTAIVSQLIATGRFPGLVPLATVLMARIFDAAMSTSLGRILRAHALALEQGVHVVSMSYGGPLANPLVAWAVQRLFDAGVFLVAAAGNSGPGLGTVEYPGAYDAVLAVAALDKSGRLADFSSRGTPGQAAMKPNVALEGVNLVMAQSPDGTMGTPVAPGYIAASGTSFACPIAAGLAAMILEARALQITPQEIGELLQASAMAAW